MRALRACPARVCVNIFLTSVLMRACGICILTCMYVHTCVCVPGGENIHAFCIYIGRNAFDIMMSVTFTLPAKITPPEGNQLRADQRLHNELIDALESMGVGWNRDGLSTGEAFTKALSSVLWYLDSHHDTLSERGVELPVPFDKFHGYNDYRRKKEKKPRLSQEGLKRHVQSLSDFLSQPWFCRPKYADLRDRIDQLVEGIKKYERYLHGSTERANVIHHSNQLVRSPVDHVTLQTISATSEPVLNDYAELTQTLQEYPNYQPVFLNDFAPTDHYERRKWVNNLQLSFVITVYRYPHGNNLGTMNFAWKVPDEVDQTLSHQTIARLNKSQKLYYTRQMKRDFLDTYTHLASKVSRKSKAVL